MIDRRGFIKRLFGVTAGLLAFPVKSKSQPDKTVKKEPHPLPAHVIYDKFVFSEEATKTLNGPPRYYITTKGLDMIYSEEEYREMLLKQAFSGKYID